MSILKELENLSDELLLFDDVMDKYEYIIDLGKSLPKMSREYKTDAYLVQGCQSQVWLHLYVKDDLVYLEADGDALIVRGLIHMLIRIYSKHSAKDILQTSPKDLETLGFSEIISQGRQNGIASMLKNIYAYAKEVEDD